MPLYGKGDERQSYLRAAQEVLGTDESKATPQPGDVSPKDVEEYRSAAKALYGGLDQSVSKSLAVSDGVDPDVHARALSLSEENKVPIEAVQGPEAKEIEDSLNRRKKNLVDIINQDPNLVKFLQDPDNAAVSKDDIPQLHATGKSISRFRS